MWQILLSKKLFIYPACTRIVFTNGRADYQAIQDVREHQLDMTQWLEYFTHGLVTQLKEVKTQAERIIKADLILSTASMSAIKERTQNVLEYLLASGKATLQECEKVLFIPRLPCSVILNY